MSRKPLDLKGQVFGRLLVIGDTGKRDKFKRQIVLSKNLDTGEFHEGTAKNYVNGNHTGFIGSDEHKLMSQKTFENNRKIRDASIRKSGVHKSSISRNHNTNVTNYRNVNYDSAKKRWRTSLVFKGEQHLKNFSCFFDAVLHANALSISLINPHIINEEDKIVKIKREDIKLNNYVKEKQKIIDKEIANTSIRRMKESKGYSWEKRQNKWHAYIRIEGKQISLGRFNTEDEAKAARKKAVDEQIKILKNQLEKDDL